MSTTDAAGTSPSAPPKPKGPIRRFFNTWIGAFVLAILILTPIRSSVVDWYDVPSGSMEPTILPGDRIVANKLAYGLRFPLSDWWIARWGTPKAGEIIICHSPKDGTRLVKRVIGTAGDTVEMRNNVLMVNGKALDNRPLTEAETAQIDKAMIGEFSWETINGRTHYRMVVPTVNSPFRSFAPVTVPEGKIWVMGDNRDRSGDSRLWGFVDVKRVRGRSGAVALSLGSNYVPRFSRFFKGLD